MAELGRALFAVVGIAITVGSLVGIAAEVRRVRRVRGWPNVVGRIVSSRIVSQTVQDWTIWRVHLDYEYRAAGQLRQASADIHVVPATRGKAEAALERYPPGVGLQVVYNPAKMDQSLLADEQSHRLDARRVCLLIIFAAIGTAIVWLFLTRV